MDDGERPVEPVDRRVWGGSIPDTAKCLCRKPQPCPTHSREAIEAQYRRIGPPPANCQCGWCREHRRPILVPVPTPRPFTAVAANLRRPVKATRSAEATEPATYDEERQGTERRADMAEWRRQRRERLGYA